MSGQKPSTVVGKLLAPSGICIAEGVFWIKTVCGVARFVPGARRAEEFLGGVGKSMAFAFEEGGGHLYVVLLDYATREEKLHDIDCATGAIGTERSAGVISADSAHLLKATKDSLELRKHGAADRRALGVGLAGREKAQLVGAQVWAKSGESVDVLTLSDCGWRTVQPDGFHGIARFAFDATHVYWSALGGARIRRASRETLAVQDVVSGEEAPLPKHLALDDAHVYWAGDRTGQIFRAPKSGGEPELLVQERDPYITSLVRRDDHLYWTLMGDTNQPTGAVRSLRLG